MPSLHISIDEDEYFFILLAARENNVKPQVVIRKVLADYRTFKQKLDTHVLVKIEEYERLKELDKESLHTTTRGGADGN